MANIVLALQGGIADGSEPTFDGQTMQKGVHLRWSFLAALGFPPGGFWLCRRAAKPGEDRIPPPPSAATPAHATEVAGTTNAGRGGPPPASGKPAWGDANRNGWQCWGVPFTLPVTVEAWPARYFGAPDPATTAAAVVALDDLKEARRRLGTLNLAAGLTPGREVAELKSLRAELVRLVQGFPTTLLDSVRLQPSSSGASAPQLSISVMDQLLLLALDPYFARVLGLYFVDDQVSPGVSYDYSITGYWGATPCCNTVVFPGLAPGAPLARGSATFAGITIAPLGGNTSLWRWVKYDGNGQYAPTVDPSAPSAVQSAANGIVGALGQAQLPDALLLAYSSGTWFQPVEPRPQLSLTLTQPVPRADVQVSGTGTVQGLSAGAIVASAGFNASPLGTVTLNAPGVDQLIDQIRVVGPTAVPLASYIVAIGAVTLHPLSPDAIGTPYAIIPPPVAIQPVAAPGQPHTTFRHRQADIDTNTLTLVPGSLFDVEFPAPPITAAQQTGNPVSDPLQLPPPILPIGFVAQRQDHGVADSAADLPGWIATRNVPKPKGSTITTANLYRIIDAQLPNPVGGWQHRVAGFDLFGALGTWNAWSAPRQVEKIAAAPTAMRIVQFDNSPAGGGAAAADGSQWSGGTLRLIVNWAGAAFMMYPGVVTARITVQSIDKTGAATGLLATQDIPVRAAAIAALTIASIVPTQQPGDSGYTVEIQTTPPLAAITSTDPAQVLMLTLPGGIAERYAVRPAVSAAAPLGATTPVVATVTAGEAARIIANRTDFYGQPAYLVSGYGTQTAISVPLAIPIAQTSARAQVFVTGSSKSPFDPNEMVVDPNSGSSQPEPQSVTLIFSGPQRLTPPVPPPPPPPTTPVHQVDHLYYDPADANGNAGRTLPFATPGGAGILGYVLQREPIRSLSLADIKRRNGAGVGLTDNNPAFGTPRPDLAAWIAALPQWLAAYNAVSAYNAAHATPPVAYTPLTVANALQDAGAQRAFIAHFHDGLLDDELCALADVPANAIGYVRVNAKNFAPGTTIADTVDGSGYGRTVYRLAAVNQAGTFSATTSSIGPYYTRIVTPPRPPVLYKLQPTQSAIIVAWALDTNPDVAAYIVYRGAAVGDLADLRYFGADPSHPAAAAALPGVRTSTQTWPPLSFVQGTAPNIDARIVGFVPDPRLCARDHAGSDMAEVVLPPGPPPTAINGVYRLCDYIPALGPLGQLAFNYWTPPAGGIAQLVTMSPTQSRLIGLRIGLGRGVPVVVVATWNATVKALGLVPVRRAGFIDGASGGAPLDANAIPGTTAPSATAPNAYAVVAVDIFGNRSASSSVFAAQMLLPVAAS